MTGELLEQMASAKLELLDLLRQVQGNGQGGESIERAPRGEPLPLSFGQEGLWLVHQMEPTSSVYHIPLTFRVRGQLQLAALEASLGAVIRRHEILRSRFPAVDGQPVQVVVEAFRLPVPLIDLSMLAGDDGEIEARQLASAHARRPFDLGAAPPWRVTVVLLSGEHLLLVNTHHILTDDESLNIFMKELGAFFQAFSRGRALVLPEPPLQYADYAFWQRQRLQGAVLERGVEFWRQCLQGAPVALELPTDWARPSRRSSRGVHCSIWISSGRMEAMEALAAGEGATLFIALLALFKVFLYRQSGQQDLVVGIPSSNRSRQVLEQVMGFFVDVLALRTDLGGELNFRRLIRRVANVVIAARSHQDLSFDKVVEHLGIERDPSRNPVFQAGFAFTAEERWDQGQPALRLEQVTTELEASMYDLDLQMWKRADGLEASFHFAADLFAPLTGKRFARRFEILLESCLTNPDQPLSRLALLSAEETHQLVYEWREGPRWRGWGEISEVSLLEAQALATPEAVAVSYRGRQLSYGELDRRGNQLANYLRKLGVGPDVLVGICLHHSLELIVGVLGILKAGGAFVPLDPAYPQDRLLFMAEDSRCSVLLTEEQLEHSFARLACPRLCLDCGWSSVAAGGSVAPRVAVTADNLAYIVYTSGSTGQPKGVMTTHRGLAHYTESVIRSYGIKSSDRVLQFSSISFDSCIEEIFSTLQQGAVLVLRETSMLRSTSDFFAALEAHAITVLILPTAYWHELSFAVAAGVVEFPASVRLTAFGGEQALAECAATWTAATRGPTFNTYGPTETTVVVTRIDLQAISAEDRGRLPEVPIGRPLENTRCCVLDRELGLVPTGMAGELHVSSVQLARGYLRRPALSAEAFVPDPFSTLPGARLYRSGDMVRYLPDGHLVFLGRTDQQVKLRGFRIELGEIEVVLRQHPQVQDAVVIADNEIPANARLVAYVVPTAEPALSRAVLREFLETKLPAYMVPVAFVEIAGLPLQPNGKVHRAALPKPQWNVEEESSAAPRTPLEELLAGLWSELLRAERVGIHDNFFALGGHSLLASRAISRVQEKFRVELPLQTLFEQPTVAGFAKMVEEAQAHGRHLAQPELAPVARDQSLVLSFNQQRLWFLAELEPDNPAYNISTAVRLYGRLQEAPLRQALQEVVARHEALRTTFESTDGSPRQVVHDDLPMRLDQVDLRSLATVAGQLEIERRVVEEARTSFDLTTGPLFRATLLRLRDEEYAFLLTLHHIVSDGWSVGVLIEELTALYGALIAGRPSPLLPLAIQYPDYAHWQRGWLRGEVLEQHLSYWRQQLAGAPNVLELATDRPRPATQSFRGGHLRINLSQSLRQDLKALCRQRSVTRFMLLSAAFNALLHRHTGQQDICVGTPIAGRQRVESENMIGFFANTLVLRSQLHGESTFGDLIERSRQVVLDAYTYQDMPFEVLVEELQPQRSLSHSPLFQVMFADDVPQVAGRLPGIEMAPLEVANGTAKFDLTLFMGSAEEGLSAEVEFNSDLFDEVTVRRLLSHFQRLLGAVVEDPQQLLRELPLISAAERHQLLAEWNDSSEQFPQPRCLADLFAAQVERTPMAVAASCGGDRLSYRQLDQRADRLARALVLRGVAANVVVALLADRGLDLLTAILAVFKAGAAYLPLDPHHPVARQRLILDSSAAPLVLASDRYLPSLREALADDAVVGAPQLQGLESLLAEESAASKMRRKSSLSDLAYVIFTSGSTGVPKGAMVEQRGMVNHLFNKIEDLTLTAGDAVAQTASQCFDISVWQFFAPLLVGGRVAIFGDRITHDAGLLIEQLEVEQITIFETVPSLLQVLLGELQASTTASRLSRLRWLIPTGEALPPGLCQRWLETFPDIPLVNAYGPTECSDDVTHQLIREPREFGAAGVPIGRPLAKLRLYVLDRWLEPQPLGAAGELCVGGVGVGRGYLGESARTAAAFMPDRFAATAGARLYRTGDLGRYRVDGSIEFLDRVDYQVKIHGFRVELGEIEKVLGEQADVDQVLVLARESPGDRRLVAYVVSSAAPPPAVVELRKLALLKLPEYMVPAEFVFLTELPLTANGKVDRQALPEPDQRRSADQGSAAPRSGTEELVLKCFSRVLGVECPDIDGDFFALGGHSLLAVQLRSRLREAFKVEVPLRALFETPTARGLAQTIDAALLEAHDASLPLARLARNGEPLALSFAQRRLWFIDQMNPHSSAYNVPLVLGIAGHSDLAPVEQALAEIVRRHEVLRTRFEASGGLPRQVIAAAGHWRLPVVDLSALPAAWRRGVADRWVEEESGRPFTLSTGPLFRVLLLRLAPDDHILMLTTHHIISDGWSQEVLMRELAALHTAYSAGKASPLAELPVQYVDYSAWQQRWLEEGDLGAAQLAYWRQRLAGAPPLLELPTDRARPAVLSQRGAVLDLRLPQALSEALESLGQTQGATLYMVLLGAFMTLLMRYTSQRDICVGTPVSGRHRSQLEGLIGFFVNTLVVRTEVADELGFRQLLAGVREATLGALNHQDLPFERLVDELAPQRSLSYSPLFQVAFSLHRSILRTAAIPGLQTYPVEFAWKTSKWDLSLNLEEGQEGLSGGLEYNVDLFDEVTIQRLAGHLRVLLDGVVSDPERQLWQLPLLPASEQAQLVAWSDTATVYPREASLPELFAVQALAHPQAVAVAYEDQFLSYGALDGAANQLARYLRRRGVEAGTLVGLYAARSPRMIVAMLAILKAGGAYVPLDLAYPATRLGLMLEDSGVEIVLSETAVASELPAFSGKVICLDTAPEVEQEKTASLEPLAAAESLAYVMYTSGSTGRPKGVAVPQQAITRLLVATNYLQLVGDERIAQGCNTSFDVATFEIWGALLHGGAVVGIAQQTLVSPALLAAELRAKKITTLFLTAAVFDQVGQELPGAFRGMRQVIFGGEAADPRWVRAVLDHQDRPRQLINGYGPTESTTFAVCHRLDHLEESATAVPIGVPISNSRVHLVDEYLRWGPIGVPGELLIAGDGLAQGYFGRPALTAAVFVPDPFATAPGGRLYRTGDRARYRAEGEIDFLGRFDHQVKIRGFRIELGEIEAVLGEQAGVEQVLVVARETPAGLRLAAYVVSAAPTAPTAAELRQLARLKLPEYMVPPDYVFLAELPLNANGKVDRKALPEPDEIGLIASERVAPRSVTETTVVECFSEILGVDCQGIDDDFFTLGGHSLLATRMISRLGDVLGVEIALQTLFETPTARGLAQTIDAALLEAHDASLPLARLARNGEPLALSFAQRRLWFIDQMNPHSSAYNVPLVLGIAGHSDLAPVEQALAEIVRRHEVLRTRFEASGGLPRQVIAAAGRWRLPVVDLSALPAAWRRGVADRWVEEESGRPFTLSTGPLFRVLLLRLAPDDHILMLTTHHIISDGWSQEVLMRELAALHTAYSAGKASPLAELPVQYADYAAWQQRWLEEGDLGAAQLAYWRQRLAAAPPLLELPADRARPAVLSQRGAVLDLRLPRALSEALESLGQTQGATLYMVFLGAFMTLLMRYTSQRDICVGTPVSGRHRSQLEGLIGFFVNTLVVRTEVADELGFRQLLAGVREATLGALSHQDLPFERLVDELAPQRSLSYSPLFQVAFSLHRSILRTAAIPGLQTYPVEFAWKTSKWDLSLSLEEGQEGLSGGLEYNVDLFDEVTIQRLAGHLRVLLDGVVSDPERQLWQLPLLPASEQAQLVAWSETATAYPREASLPELFAVQALIHPQAVAVAYEDQVLSYRALDGAANQLARYLRRRGVEAGTLVGLYAGRSPQMIVAMLAILKAGGAYVPLDLAYPAARLGLMLEDSGVEIVLSETAVASELPAFSGKVICLDTAPEVEQEKTAPLEPLAAAESLAYVMYTSGSTGRPKGVAVPQQAIARLLVATNYLQLVGDERVAQASNTSFDAASFEIWGALLHGGAVVGIAQQTLISPTLLAAELRAKRITTLFLTTAVFHQIGSEAPGALAGLRQVLFGGEAIDPRWVRAVLGAGSPEHLLHVYGPTESTTFASWQRVEEVPAEATTVAIGRALANSTLEVVDRHSGRVPMGVAGELLIGGDGLAWGYFRRPTLTAEKFVPNPFSSQPGGRLYHTGDRVCYRAGGAVEFLGRFDHQVKIRGFRIELGEIEAVLGEQAGVEQVLVMARETPAGLRLAAYVVSAAPTAPTAAELRQLARLKLPEYMVPPDYVFLAELPLNANGKVDRKALPEPDEIGLIASERVAPRSVTETTVVECFSEILGVDCQGIDDDFFTLGGHSLLATRMISRLGDVLGVEIALQTLFETPTARGLAQTIDAALLEAHDASLPLARLARNGEPLALSFAQRRLWFIDQMNPHSSAYNVPLVLGIAGHSDLAPVEQALAEIVRRHEVLRTRFEASGGLPRQVVAAAGRWRLPVVDLSALPAAWRRGVADRWVEEESGRPFTLSTGPLFRVLLLRLAPDDHILMLTTHHIISDGWSQEVLMRELAALHTAYSAGKASPLAELPVQYVDYSAWQQRWLEEGDLGAAQLAYWRQRLAGAPPLLELPTDRARPAVLSQRGAVLDLRLPQALSEALESLGQTQGATLYMVLLGAFMTLLMRYTSQRDICVGTPVSGRHRSQLEGLIGFFVNTLVVRTEVADELGFRQLLAGVREATLGALNHQDLPFERLVDELAPQRSLSYSPLFQVAFSLHRSILRTAAIPGLQTYPVEFAWKTSKWDLSLNLEEGQEGLSGGLEYNVDLFDEVTIQRLAGHLRVLLDGVVSDPERQLWQLPLLPASEQAQLVAWSDTATVYPREASLPELFAVQALAHPQAVAVAYEDQFLSYGALDGAANQLARYLRRRGVEAGTLVGLYAARSPRMIVAMLAILKAGGAYVPLDLAYPATRLGLMLEDSGVEIVLSETAVASELPAFSGKVICLDTAPEVEQEKTASLEPLAAAESLAYVMYTSGSTGRPKGVAVPQQAITRLLVATNYLQLVGDERIAQGCNTSFDVATFEIWGALLHGGAVVGIAQQTLVSPALLAAELRAKKITTLFLTAAVFDQVGQELPGAFRGMRQVIFGGEAADPRWVRAVLDHQDRPRQLINGYGPTESTTFAVCHRLDHLEESATAVPIGVPISNSRVHLVDEYLRWGPIGVPGELLIAGDGLAQGYFGRPALTAAVFVPDPFATAPGGRLYRTGDRARYRAEGEIDFLGRFDHQVKIRGFRIELGEIEAVLGEQAGVEQVLVVARETPAGLRLAAYVVSAAPTAPTAAELRQLARLKLPEYMVPPDYVFLAELPLNANSKVDRKALPEPQKRSAKDGDFTAPRTPIEELLSNIWCELLGQKQCDIDLSFFELGGHSLLATQLISRLQASLGLELQLRTLFEESTIRQLGAVIDTELRGDSANVEPINRAPREGELPLSYAQQRLWFLHQLMPDSPAYNMPLALRLEGRLMIAALERAFVEVLQRHESLRTTFFLGAAGPAQVITRLGPWRLPLVDLADLSPEDREVETGRLVGEEAALLFDLTSGPLIRTRMLRQAAERHVLLITLHHVISDGWSMGLLSQELGELYSAYSTGQDSPLAKLPVQYVDFAAWQRQWLEGGPAEVQLKYWRHKLADAPPLLELPTDRPRPALQSLRGGTLGFELSVAVTEALEALGRRCGATLYMVILAAFQTLLMRISRQQDIVVGSPIAGRSRLEIEPLIGFFVNTLVLRSDLSGNPSFEAFLANVRAVALEAFAHQDLPFEWLVEELQPERALSYSPLFQVMLAFQNLPSAPTAVGDLEIEDFDSEQTTARFDLLLSMTEDAGRMRGVLEYSSELFDGTTVERYIEYFQRLLLAIATTPERSLLRFDLLSKAERQQIVEWNDTGDGWPPTGTLTELFQQQVQRQPEAIAAIFAAARLSYGELDRQANRLAHKLASLGVGPDVVVGIMAERSLEMMIAVLAVLKAGGAYLPLDPSYPEERLAFMIEDAEVTALLTQQRLLVRLPPLSCELLCLDRDRGSWAAMPAKDPRTVSLADSLAYVIYTSGSTGRPKGVAMPQGALVNLIRWQLSQSRFGGGLTLQFASLSFDVSVQEIFSTWCAGGTLVLVDEQLRRDTPNLLERMNQQPVERMFLPFVALQQMAEAAVQRKRIPRALRETFIAGEQLRLTTAVREFFRRQKLSTLNNHYGPTEGHVVTSWTDSNPASCTETLPPIGCAIDHTKIYLCDSLGAQAPAGVPGELLIGGVALARGYLDRPAFTATSFVPDRFSVEAGERLYRTGDLARWRASGEIDFLRRIDQQVKVRGFRIEPGEIDTALEAHPRVCEAVAAILPDGPTTSRLIAYLVVSGDGEFDPAELPRFLAKSLPDYMIPQTFVELQALPLTPSGKIDRRSLPTPQSGLQERDTTAPRTMVERLLVGMWRRLLVLKSVGIHEDFFDLHGHSLIAPQVMLRIHETFAVDLPLIDLFDTPTIAGLAEKVEAFLARGETAQGSAAEQSHQIFGQHRLWFMDYLQPGSAEYKVGMVVHEEGTSNIRALYEVIRMALKCQLEQQATVAGDTTSPLMCLQNGGSRPPLFCVHPTGGEIFCYARLARLLGREGPFYGLRDTSIEGKAATTTIEGMAQRYAGEIRKVQSHGPYFLSGWSMGGFIAFEMARQIEAAGGEVAFLGLIDSKIWVLQEMAQLKGLSRLVSFGQQLGLDESQRKFLSRTKGNLKTVEEAMPRFQATLTRAGHLPSSVTLSQLKELYVNFERHVDALSQFCPSSYAGKLDLFLAEKRTRMEPKDLDGGWQGLAAELEVHLVQGDHFSIVREPDVIPLANILGQRLQLAGDLLSVARNSK